LTKGWPSDTEDRSVDWLMWWPVRSQQAVSEADVNPHVTHDRLHPAVLRHKHTCTTSGQQQKLTDVNCSNKGSSRAKQPVPLSPEF